MGHLDFVLSGATFTGTAHTEHRRNNQDFWCVRRSSDRTIVVVNDGCGSGAHSEYGAIFGAHYLAGAIDIMLNATHRLDRRHLLMGYLEEIERHIASIFGVFPSDGKAFEHILDDYFLHTTALAILSRTSACFLRFGDAHVTVNGVTYQSEMFDGNAPPMVAYPLFGAARLKTLRRPFTAEQLEFTTVKKLPIGELRHFVLGSDGVDNIVRHANDPLPGREPKVGGLDQFWTAEDYRDTGLLEQRLALIGSPYPGRRGRPSVKGHLTDDTTLVVGVRVSPDTDTTLPLAQKESP